MKKQELLLLFQSNASDDKLRQVITEIIKKVCHDSIDREILNQIALKAVDLKEEISRLREILRQPDVADKQILEVLVDFYFQNVEKAFSA